MTTLIGEEVDNSIHRLIGVIGMQSRQTEMSGLGKCNGVLHRLRVTNLANQDHIGCLTQGIDQRIIKGLGIDTHLTLSDDALFVLMNKFKRIFNGDDMPRGIAISIVDHRGQ